MWRACNAAEQWLTEKTHAHSKHLEGRTTYLYLTRMRIGSALHWSVTGYTANHNNTGHFVVKALLRQGQDGS